MSADPLHRLGPGSVAMAAGFAALGLVCLAIAAVRTLRADAAAGWPSVTGVIEATGVRRNRSGSAGVSASRDRHHYHVDVVYAYEVGGVRHRSDVVGFAHIDGSHDTQAQAEAAAAAWRIGDPVTVYYNPRDPAVACLQRDPPSRLWWLWLFGGAFVVLGPVLPLADRDARRRRAAARAARVRSSDPATAPSAPPPEPPARPRPWPRRR